MNAQLQTQAKATSQATPSLTPVRTNLIQRKCACGGTLGLDGECAQCRGKRLTLQRRRSMNQAEPAAVPPIVREVVHSPGQSLDPVTRAFFETRFGHDFSRVTVHTDSKATESAEAVNALAYTFGSRIVFGRHGYAPGTARGNRLLAHELTHVIQHSFGTSDINDLTRISQPSDVQEGEAEHVAAAVLNDSSTERAKVPYAQIPVIQRATPGLLTRAACQESARLTSPEHQLIQSDYQININPNSAREYAIPESSENGIDQGYADLVDLTTYGIYDIKNPSDNLQKSKEQTMRYRIKAEEHCDSVAPWHLGIAYPSPRIVASFEPDTELIVELIYPGILQYGKRKRERERALGREEIFLLLMLLAAAAAKKLATSSPIGPQTGAGKPGNPILAIIQLLAVATVIVLSERQAAAGEKRVDDDPLVALAQMLDDTGHKMPPEIRKLIEDDPALRELLRIEIEKRRRGGAKSDTHLGSDTPHSKLGMAPSDGVPEGAIPRGSAEKRLGEPEPLPSERKAIAPSPDVSDRSDATHREPSASAESYWQSCQRVMNLFDWSTIGPKQAQLVWPPEVDFTALKPKQEVTTFSYGRSGERRYVFGLVVEIVARVGQNTTFRVKWRGGILTSDGNRLAPPVAYEPGTIFTAPDHSE